VRVLWGVVLLTIALRHTGFEACLGELRRNPALAKLIGIRSIRDVPRGWNISRFLDVLGQEPHRLELEAMFNQMIQRLGEVVPDLGRATAGDSTSLKARRLRRDRPRKPRAATRRPLSRTAHGRHRETGEDRIRRTRPAAAQRGTQGVQGRERGTSPR